MKYTEFLDSFRRFVDACPEDDLDEHARYLFLSDLHMGDGGSRDDLAHNRDLLAAMLAGWYLEQDYFLILNGDIEDLNKFRLQDVRKAWAQVLEIIGKFAERGRLRKIVGNHDFDLLNERNYPWPLYEGIVYRWRGNRICVFHGHQASSLYVKFDILSEFLVRYFVKTLHIRNSGVSKDSRRRFAAERRIYRAARSTGIMAITGHTHRPLFESLSKYDNIRIIVENLIRRYIDATDADKKTLEAQIRMYRTEMESLVNERQERKKTQSLYGAGPFLIPCFFNSGCATGKRSLTALEIVEGRISLVYWTAGTQSHPYIESEHLAIDTLDGRWCRYTLQSERMDSVFTRIRLLGDRQS